MDLFKAASYVARWGSGSRVYAVVKNFGLRKRSRPQIVFPGSGVVSMFGVWEIRMRGGFAVIEIQILERRAALRVPAAIREDWSLGFRGNLPCSGSRVEGSRFRVWSLEFRVQGSGLRIWSLWSRFWSLRCRV